MALSIHHRGFIAAIAVFLLSGFGPSIASAAHATLKNIPPTPHFAPLGTPLADIAAAIKIGAAVEDWELIGETPGNISLMLRVRSHKAKVIVGYDASTYWIDYLDSFNLDYSPNDWRRPGPSRRVVKGPRIHHNYNKWVEELSSAIASHAKVPPKAVGAPPASPSNLLLIADELEKLDTLRERGVLTQGEFDLQKAKLLSR